MNTYLKTLGTGDNWLDDFWVKEKDDLKLVAFPSHRTPQIEAGDRIVIYASGHQRLIAAGKFTSGVRHDPDVNVARWNEEDAKRWPYVADWEPQVLVPFIHLGPHLTEIGVETLSVRSQSHIHITEAQYRKAVGLLAGAAAVNGEVYVPAYRDSVSLG